MKNCRDASESLMLAGAEKAALATTGKVEVLVSVDIRLKPTQCYLPNVKMASISEGPRYNQCL